MNMKNNKRKRESMQKIEQVLVEFLQTKELNQISVSDICKKAGLNRSTFYANYIDIYIYDLADTIRKKLEDEVSELYKDEITEGFNSNNYLVLFQHIKDNPIFYQTYFKLGYDEIMQFPVMIEHKKFSRIPAEAAGIFIWRNFQKWFIYKYINCMYAVFVCVFFQVCCNFFPDFRFNKVKYSTAKDNGIASGCTEVSYVSFKEIYISVIFFCKLFSFFYSVFRQVKSCYNITITGKKNSVFSFPAANIQNF